MPLDQVNNFTLTNKEVCILTNILKQAESSNGEAQVRHDFDPGLGWYSPGGHVLQNASPSSLNVCFGQTTKEANIS